MKAGDLEPAQNGLSDKSPTRVPTGFHPHTHLHPLRREIAIEPLRSLAVFESQLVPLSSFAIHKCNWLEAGLLGSGSRHCYGINSTQDPNEEWRSLLTWPQFAVTPS